MEIETPVADGEHKEKDSEDTSPDQSSLVDAWTKRIETLENDHKDHWEVIQENRERAWGDLHKEEDAGTMRINVVHAHIKKAVNRAYARNPEFAIRPTRFVNPSSIPMWRMFGQTAEIILNRAFTDAKFKRRAKTCLRAAKTSRIGWLKVRWQQETQIDGNVINRIRDTNDELARLKKLETDAEDSELSEEERAGKVLEAEELLEILEEKKEFVALQGLIFDSVSPKNIMLPTKHLENFDEYVNVPYMVERVWKNVDEVKEKYPNADLDGVKYYKQKIEGVLPSDSAKEKQGQTAEDGDVVLLYEIWDIESQRVKILPHGGRKFLANFVPKKLGERWYPYFALAQNQVDGQFFPLSDVELIKELAEEINNSLTKYRDHRDICVPHWIGDSQTLKEGDVKSYVHATLGEIILVEGQVGKRMSEIIEPANHPTIDPAVYQITHLEAAIEKVAGGGEVTNPKSNRSRTLGEAKELASDTGTDVSADTDEIEDWFQDIAQYVLEILLQRLTIEDAEAIAGPRATPVKKPEPAIDPVTGQPKMGPGGEPMMEEKETGELNDGTVWPASSAQEIFNNVHFVVKAGSSGKPGAQQEVQVWTQFLLPRITDLIAQVGELRKNGMNDQAESLLFVAKETLKRVEPYFDINEFVKPPSPPTPQEEAAEAMQMEQGKKGLQKLESENEKIQAETARILADKAVKELELEKLKAETRFTAEQIESLNLDDTVKSIMSNLQARMLEVEADVKQREIGQKDRELDIKEIEAESRAKQIAKPNEGGRQ